MGEHQAQRSALAVPPVLPRARPTRATPPLPALARCRSGRTLHEVCSGLTDDLLELGFDLPSVYLLTGDRLRCHGARGYFQVVDGFRVGTGVIGRAVADGRAEFIPDVRLRPEFIGAVPDLVAEACAPVRSGGRVVGAVNLESRSVLPDSTPAVLAAAAALLGRRIEELGGLPQPSPAQRLAQIAVELTAAVSVEQLELRAVRAAVELSGMSSAAVARVGTGATSVTCATGPLSEALAELSPEALAVMAGWVSHETSSHFPGGEDVPADYGFLRGAGVRAVSVHPLVVRGDVHGLLVLADEEPVAHAPAMVDMLELLAAQTAAALAMANLLHDLAERAEEDELTGLANRSGFERALERALAARAPGDQVAVLLLDLDDFKHVNDSLGHQAGDRMLVEVAARLKTALRADDTACRLGGDEFVAVLPGVSTEAAVAVAERLLDAVALTTSGDESWLATTVSIGVALADDTAGSGRDAAELLRSADLAMYLAKGRGKGGYAVFEPQLRTAAVDRMDMTRELRRALLDDGLHLAYQPVVDLVTGALAGVEALVRWDHPRLGSIPPVEFVPLAEQTGDIVALGVWVLREACAQLLQWDADGGDSSLVLCVNVSTRQLERPGLLETLDACLDDGVDPARLVLEITETALVQDSAVAADTLQELRARGVRLAVDDFGTGYSSLARLRSAPVSRLKVDRSFVSEITDRGTEVPIVEATLAMARGLGLGVVAEGVETVEQLSYLRRFGCPEGQGYLIARPLPPEAVGRLIAGDLPWAHLFEA